MRFSFIASNPVHTATSVVALLFLSLAMSCGDSNNSGAEATRAVTATAGDLHACDLLSAAEVGRIVGETVAESRVDVEKTNGANAMSQCTHSFTGAASNLTVQVRRSGKAIGQSRQADAEIARSEDDGTGFGKQMGDAIASGNDIEGLGTLAYSYEIGNSLHVVAYWNTHFGVWVWTRSGPNDKDRVLQIEQAAAQLVVDKL